MCIRDRLRVVSPFLWRAVRRSCLALLSDMMHIEAGSKSVQLLNKATGCGRLLLEATLTLAVMRRRGRVRNGRDSGDRRVER